MDGQQPDHHLNPEAVIFANPIAQGACAAVPLPAPLICLSMFCSGVPVRGQYVPVQWLGE